MTNRAPTYLLVLQPEKSRRDDPGGVRALRTVLKRLLRNHGLKCLAVTAAPEEIESGAAR